MASTDDDVFVDGGGGSRVSVGSAGGGKSSRTDAELRVSVGSAGRGQTQRVHPDLPAGGHRALRRCKSTGSGGRADSVTRSRSFGRRYVSVKVKTRQGK